MLLKFQSNASDIEKKLAIRKEEDLNAPNQKLRACSRMKIYLKLALIIT